MGGHSLEAKGHAPPFFFGVSPTSPQAGPRGPGWPAEPANVSPKNGHVWSSMEDEYCAYEAHLWGFCTPTRMSKTPRDGLRRPTIHLPSRAKHANFGGTHSLAQVAIRGLRGRPEGRGAYWGKKRGVGDPLLRVRALPRVPMTLYCCCGFVMQKKTFSPTFLIFRLFSIDFFLCIVEMCQGALRWASGPPGQI